MDKPLLSFVIPTKNRREWVAESIFSLMAQTEKNIEIVVVNDGSEDGTKEFLDEWAAKDPRVKIIHNPTSLGAGPSRNLGTVAASADIVCQFDDDDISLDERAEMTLQWFKDHPESELVNFPYVCVSYFNEVIENFEGAPFDEELFKKEGGVTYFSNPTIGYKRGAFLKTGGYKKEGNACTDDYGFVQNWIGQGKKIDFCPGDPVVLHRNLPGSMTSQFRGWKEEWASK